MKKSSKVLRLDSVDSTNEEAKQRVRASGDDIARLEKINKAVSDTKKMMKQKEKQYVKS